MGKHMLKHLKSIHCRYRLLAALSSAVRVTRLRLKGYHIGNRVYIGKGVIISAKHVDIADDVYILDRVTIKGLDVSIGANVCIYENVYVHVKNMFSIGQRAKISRNCVWKAHNIEIQRDLWCNENVEIGGGGWNSPNASITIGPFTHIGRDVHLNVCEGITLKGYTGIGMGCMLFTHSVGQGQSVLKGYPNTKAPIVIGEHVSLYSRVIAAPGTIVEDGTTVAAGSYIQGYLEKRSFYAGSPAKLKKVYADPSGDLRMRVQDFLKLEESANGNLTGMIGKSKIICIESEQTLPGNCRNCIIIFTKPSSSCDMDNCYIDIENSTISGSSWQDTEKMRDLMRRNGVILMPVEDYIFSKIDPFELRNKGIEL